MLSFLKVPIENEKANGSSAKAADFILVDYEGCISAMVWGELTECICDIWREVVEARQRGVNSQKTLTSVSCAFRQCLNHNGVVRY